MEKAFKEPIRHIGLYSSAFRLAYLLVFLYTCGSVLRQFWKLRNDIFAELVKQSAGADWLTKSDWWLNVFCALFFVFLLALICHLMRIYVTTEMLENPASMESIKFTPIQSPFASFLDQTIRILVVVAVSYKILAFLPDVDDLNSLAIYLFVVYGILLIWDLFVMFASKENRKLALSSTFPLSILGFAIASLFLLLTWDKTVSLVDEYTFLDKDGIILKPLTELSQIDEKFGVFYFALNAFNFVFVFLFIKSTMKMAKPLWMFILHLLKSIVVSNHFVSCELVEEKDGKILCDWVKQKNVKQS